MSEFKCNLMMPSEAMQIFFQGPLKIYLQHILQTNIYFENTPAPSPPPLGIEWWPTKV